MLETAARDVFRAEWPGQSHPADGSGNVARAAQNFAINEDAGADAGADGEENGVLASPGCALPGLPQDGTGAVAFDDDRRSSRCQEALSNAEGGARSAEFDQSLLTPAATKE